MTWLRGDGEWIRGQCGEGVGGICSENKASNRGAKSGYAV